MTDATEFRWHRPSIRRIELLLAPVLAIGVLLLLSDGAEAWIMGVAWLAVFLSLIARLEWHARRNCIVITVNREELFDRRMSYHPFAWAEIVSVEDFEAEHMRYVGIVLKEPRATGARLRWLPRVAYPLQRLLGFPGLSISMSLLDGTTDDLVAAIQRLRPDLPVVRS